MRWMMAILMAAMLASCGKSQVGARAESVALGTTEYQVFLPLVMQQASKRGVTMTSGICSDLGLLGARWTYQWVPNYSPCPGIESLYMIPDAYTMDAIVGPGEWLLVFNEPDLGRQTPEQAAVNWRYIENRFPARKLAGLGVSQYGYDWIVQWRAAYIAAYGLSPRLDALAWHCYSGVPSGNCDAATRDEFTSLASAWGSQSWLTEWAVLSCYEPTWQVQMQEMLQWVMEHTDRSAWFTTRMPPDSPYWVAGCDTGLLDWYTGLLTDQGTIWVAYPFGI